MLNTVHPQSQIHVSLCFIKAEDPREAHSGKKGIKNIYLNMYLYKKIFCLIFEGLKKKCLSFLFLVHVVSFHLTSRWRCRFIIQSRLRDLIPHETGLY